MCDLSAYERFAEWRIRAWIWLADHVRRWLQPASLIIGGIVVLYGAGQLAKGQDVPKEAWEAGSVENTLLVVLGVAAALGYFFVTRVFASGLKRSEQEGRLYKICRDIARIIESNTSIPHNELGVHVWSVSGPPTARYLRRRTSFLAVGRRHLGIIWNKGKGAIGTCWAQESPVIADVDELDRLGPDEATFCALARTQRLGLTWADFEKARDYRAIWAVPLMRGHAFRGCLSIDTHAAGKADELDQAVDTLRDELDPLLDLCEEELR